jgi:1,2-diacylglycerol 3-beta-galactosyltransferase
VAVAAARSEAGAGLESARGNGILDTVVQRDETVGRTLPGETRRPVTRGVTHARTKRGVAEQGDDARGELPSVTALDEVAADRVGDDVDQPAYGRSDDRRARRLGLQGDQTEGLGARGHHADVGERVEIGKPLRPRGAKKAHPVADTQRFGHGHQPAALSAGVHRLAATVAAVLTDDQGDDVGHLGTMRDRGHRLEEGVGSLETFQPARVEDHAAAQETELAAQRCGRSWRELVEVDTWGNDTDTLGRGAVQVDERRLLGRAHRNHAIGGADQDRLHLGALRVCGQTDRLLQPRQGVEGLHQRDVPALGDAAAGPPAQPVVGVHQAISALFGFGVFEEPAAECREMAEDLALRQRFTRTRLKTHQATARSEHLFGGTVGIVAPYEDVAGDAACRQAGAQAVDDVVHAAVLTAAELAEWRRVHRQHGERPRGTPGSVGHGARQRHERDPARVTHMGAPLLFLVADTGGGHRACAGAVARAITAGYPGRFSTHVLNPFDDAAPSLVGNVTRLYSPLTRRAPWLWGALYHATDSAAMVSALRTSVLRLVEPGLDDVLRTVQPAAVVSFHPLLNHVAARSRRRVCPAVPLITVVTDLVDVHAAWICPDVDALVTASPVGRDRCRRAGIPADRCLVLGLPVDASFAAEVLTPAERRALRSRLGLDSDRFTVLLTGGGEGSGGILRRARALLGTPGLQLIVICGRNASLAERVSALPIAEDTRLVVHGFVDNMAEWMRSADVAVSKAGPGTIAEALCCEVPLLLTAHLPGQEHGNIDYVLATGTGSYVPRIRDLVGAVAELARPGSAALASMRDALHRMARPNAAVETAAVIAEHIDNASVSRTP